MLMALAKKLRVFFYTHFRASCFTHVFSACKCSVNCVQYGVFSCRKHACNADIPVACTVGLTLEAGCTPHSSNGRQCGQVVRCRRLGSELKSCSDHEQEFFDYPFV